jgi:hypothetical protein
VDHLAFQGLILVLKSSNSLVKLSDKLFVVVELFFTLLKGLHQFKRVDALLVGFFL